MFVGLYMYPFKGTVSICLPASKRLYEMCLGKQNDEISLPSCTVWLYTSNLV